MNREIKPEEKWCTNKYFDSGGKRCAIGHLKKDFQEYGNVEMTVRRLTGDWGCNLAEVNDGRTGYKQPTPKQRVLAYLKDEINKC